MPDFANLFRDPFSTTKCKLVIMNMHGTLGIAMPLSEALHVKINCHWRLFVTYSGNTVRKNQWNIQLPLLKTRCVGGLKTLYQFLCRNVTIDYFLYIIHQMQSMQKRCGSLDCNVYVVIDKKNLCSVFFNSTQSWDTSIQSWIRSPCGGTFSPSSFKKINE